MIKLVILKYTKQKQTENKTNKSTNKNHSVHLDPKKNCEPTPGTSGATTRHQPCTTIGK